MSQKIAVIGTGYVGLVSAVGLADFGNQVIGVDLNPEIIEKLSRGIPTIYEHGLTDYLERNVTSGRLSFTTGIARAVGASDIVFIAVGTPSNDDGSADLSQVKGVIRSLAESAKGRKIVVTKSTVPVGTNRWISRELEKLTPQGGGTFSVVSNPEFLREGRAVQDFFHPDRIVLGIQDNSVKPVLEDIYRPLYLISTPFVWGSWETAELAKYAANAFLATKITFINQMANLAEACGADVHSIAKTMGMDGRISPKFLHPGPGYGGSCFPKDTRALAGMGKERGVPLSLVEEVIRSNERQKLRVAARMKELLHELSGKKIAVLGLAFKAETDDVRESPSLSIVPALLSEGAAAALHDPKAADNFIKHIQRTPGADRVTMHPGVYEAVDGADGILILTEWNEYRNMDLKRIRSLMKGNLIYDTRNVLDAEEAAALGFRYYGTGR
jgi:UDPglucose 6-dehydrogenase